MRDGYLAARRRRAALLPVAAVVATAGCSADSATGTGGTTGTGVNPTYVRLLQVVSDAAGGVNVTLNGSSATATPIGFGVVATGAGTDYAAVVPTPTVAFTAAGFSTAFFNQTVSSLTSDARSTLVGIGRATPGTSPAATVAVLADTTAVSTTGLLVRVFNAVDYLPPAGGDPVDVYIYPQGSARPAVPDAAGLAWGARTAYLLKATGTYTVDVFAAGASRTGTPAFTATLSATFGFARTLVLVNPAPGAAAGAAGSVLVLTDRGT